MTEITNHPLYFCNQAFLSLGGTAITDLNDNNLSAELAKNLYPLVRDHLLARHPWRFLLKSQLSLPENPSPNPTWQTQYPQHRQYLLPDNLITLLTPLDGDTMLADNLLLTRQSAPVINATLKTAEPHFPIFFQKLLVLNLTAEFALPLTEDIVRADFLIKKAERQYQEAKSQDSLWQGTPHIKASYPLLNTRPL